MSAGTDRFEAVVPYPLDAALTDVADLNTIVAKIATKRAQKMNAIPLTLKVLFSSKLRVKVLTHFFFHPGERFHVRGLASELGEPVGTTGRELGNLERAGILSSRRIGNQKHYGPSEDSPVVEDLRNIFLKTAGASAELRQVLERFPGVELGFIYGSYASGEAHASSDIDLMVVGDISEAKFAPAVARVERRLKREVNYTAYTRHEVEKRLGKRGDFVNEVFRGPRIVLTGNADDRLFQTGR